MSTQPVGIITGASSGIGAAAAREFAARGYRVALAARRLDRLQALANEIQSAGGEALPLQVDITRLDQVQGMVTATLERFGRIDVLFANAGFGRLDFLKNLDPENDVKAQIDVNLTGVIWSIQAVLPHLIRQRSGHILLMSSVAGYVSPHLYSVYSATKFAVRSFGQALGREVKAYGVHVSTICPGPVHTEFGSIASPNDRLTSLSAPDWLNLTDGQVAKAVYGLVEHPRRTLVLPWFMRIAGWAETLAPWLVDWAAAWIFVRNRKAQ